METAPDEWLSIFATSLKARRVPTFPVERGLAWRIGSFVVHVQTHLREISAVAVTAGERVGDDANLDSASNLTAFPLEVDDDPHVAAQRLLERLRSL